MKKRSDKSQGSTSPIYLYCSELSPEERGRRRRRVCQSGVAIPTVKYSTGLRIAMLYTDSE